MREEFKTEFRKSDSYRRTNKHFSDSEIFAISRDGMRFIRPKTQAAYTAWLKVNEDTLFRQAFETAFKETDHYMIGLTLLGGRTELVFGRYPSGEYHHPVIALAWKFYELGAK